MQTQIVYGQDILLFNHEVLYWSPLTYPLSNPERGHSSEIHRECAPTCANLIPFPFRPDCQLSSIILSSPDLVVCTHI